MRLKPDTKAWLAFWGVILTVCTLMALSLTGCLSIGLAAVTPLLDERKVIPLECKVLWVEGDEVVCVKWGPHMGPRP